MKVPPTISLPEGPYEVEVGETMMYTCRANSHPPSNLTWTLPNGDVSQGAVLEITNMTQADIGTYLCTADNGYATDYKAVDISMKEIDYCSRNPCKNGGTCTNRASGFQCACPAGYEGDTCQTEIDYNCSPNPCKNGGTCTDRASVFQCTCLAGYEGDTCQTERPLFGVGVVVGAAVASLVGGLLLVGGVTLLILRCRSSKKKEHDIAEEVYEDVQLTPGRAVSQRSGTGSDLYSYPMAPLAVPPLPVQPSGNYQELRPAVYQSLQTHERTTPQPQNSTGDRSAFTISHDFST
ncbi:uncharacterized protein LOC144863280 [Branchiostoma floridae x Branchiostoma japonicum]